jgi:lysophospholipase L1-like esterase
MREQLPASITIAILLAACDSSGSYPPLSSSNIGASQTRVPVVFIGDSITLQWNIVGHPYLTQLVPGAINAGVGGETSAEQLARFQVDVIDVHPDAVVIEAGTDDLLYADDPDFYTGPLNDMDDVVPTINNIWLMSDAAQKAGIRVLIASLPVTSIPSRHVSAAAVADFNRKLISLCEAYGYVYVNHQSALQIDGRQNMADFLPDGIHPNAAGYDVMWPVLRAALDVANVPL